MPPDIAGLSKIPPVQIVLDDKGLLDRALSLKGEMIKGLSEFKANRSAIAVLQFSSQDGRWFRVITTMDARVYDYLQRNPKLLGAGEILGPEPFSARELVGGVYKAEKYGKANLPIHCEQLAGEYVRSLNAVKGTVATSALGCPTCESYFKDHLHFKHVNLESEWLLARKIISDANRAAVKLTKAWKKFADLNEKLKDAIQLLNEAKADSAITKAVIRSREKKVANLAEKLKLAAEDGQKAAIEFKGIQAKAKSSQEFIDRWKSANKVADQVASSVTEGRRTTTAARGLATKSEAVTDAEEVARARGTASKAVSDTHTNSRATVGEIEAVVKEAKGVAKAEEAASKVSKAERFLEFSLEGGKFIGRAGKYLFKLLEVTGLNIVGDLLMLNDAIDFFFDWLNRDKIREEQEWKRIINYLSSKPERIPTGWGNQYYVTSISDRIVSYIETDLQSADYKRNFQYWLEKWMTDKAWDGFVYTVVKVNLMKQQRSPESMFDADEDYNTKYYNRRFSDNESSYLYTSFSESNQLKNTKKESSGVNIGTENEQNLTTGGHRFRSGEVSGTYDSYDVECTDIDLVYTLPCPCLTPFDFVIVKCKILISLVITYLSQYDPNIVDGNNVNLSDEFYIGPFDQYKFPNPLNTYNIQVVFWAVWQANYQLNQHSPAPGDLKADRNQSSKYTRGWSRRSSIVHGLISPVLLNKKRYDFKGQRLFYHVALKLNNLGADDKKKGGITTDDLCNYAMDIDNDILKILKDLKTNDKYNYC